MSDLLTAIQTLATKLIPNSTGDKRQAYVQRLADYALRLAGHTEASVKAGAAVDWSGTWDEAYAKWLEASDAALIAAGKPAGHDGTERGALDRETSIALAKSIGVFDELGGDNGLWGPPPDAGTIA